MGIFSELGAVATGGMSVIQKYAIELSVVLVLVIGAFFYGHHEGSLGEKNVVLAAANKAAAKVVTITKTQSVVDTTAVTGLSTELAKVNSENAKLQNKLNTIKNSELTHSQNGSCVLSQSWLDLYNQSIRP